MTAHHFAPPKTETRLFFVSHPYQHLFPSCWISTRVSQQCVRPCMNEQKSTSCSPRRDRLLRSLFQCNDNRWALARFPIQAFRCNICIDTRTLYAVYCWVEAWASNPRTESIVSSLAIFCDAHFHGIKLLGSGELRHVDASSLFACCPRASRCWFSLSEMREKWKIFQFY